MKRCSRILVGVVLAILLFAGNGMAFPFIEVEGFVHPNSATWIDKGDGSWFLDDLLYTFRVTETASNAKMDKLYLEFENDVFVDIDGIGGADVSDVQFFTPTDWTYSEFPSSGSNYILSFAGTLLGVGDILEFTVDTNIYDIALNDTALWQEGAIWSQSWAAGDTLGGSDGGSTAVATPEPATMMLLGSGLIVLAGFGRRKFLKKTR